MTQLNPKYFSSSLTGENKNAGILTLDLNLKSNTATYKTFSNKRDYKNGNVVVKEIPIHPIHPDVFTSLIKSNFDKEINDYVLLKSTSEYNLYFNIEVTQIELETRKTTYSKAENNHKVGYRLNLIKVNSGVTKCTTHLTNHLLSLEFMKNNTHYYTEGYNTWDMINHIKSLLVNIEYDENALFRYINDYSLYDELTLTANRWQHNMDAIVKGLFEYNKGESLFMSNLHKQMLYLDVHKIDLSMYKNIYHTLTNHPEITHYNLNTQLFDLITGLEQNKVNLTPLPEPDESIVPTYFTDQQKAAITSNEPMALIQAVAGSGKSTTLLQRIAYLKSKGIDEHSITVLSFTNAAADNIKEKNENVNSFTIASLVNKIYTENFPLQQLSSIPTLANTIDIYFKNDILANTFKSLLRKLMSQSNTATVNMNNFIKLNTNKVIDILNKTGQTTLELQIIICQQLLLSLKEPDDIYTEHLIVDETQDNSIFDFIFLLSYVRKHNATLFIVGDASQTLYEFRGANPKALNIIEMSNVFKAYKLEINYRSSQYILDFANTLLSDIETNQYANLRLQTSNPQPYSEVDFRNTVQIEHNKVSKLTDIRLSIHDILTNMNYYIDEKLRNDEKVAFLAYSRNEILAIEESLKILYPDITPLRLMSDRSASSTMFSMFIKHKWNEMKLIPAQDILKVITDGILSYTLENSANPEGEVPFIEYHLKQWVNMNLPAINDWFNHYSARQISKYQYLDNIQSTLIEYELHLNAISSNKDEEEPKIDSNIILSTIHGSKGLEFDNVVVLYKQTKELSEENKRMYYVALTRAMLSEYIISYGTGDTSTLLENYNDIIFMNRGAK